MQLTVQGFLVRLDKDGYVCLTDIAKAGGNKEAIETGITKWLSSKSTLEYLGLWEQINNSYFKLEEFVNLRENWAQDSSIKISKWIELTDATGLYVKRGKEAGTYAHRDIAFEFGAAISPAFKLYLIKEYQRLKEQELNSNNVEWNVRRVLSKAHYHIQTDAVKDYKIPFRQIPLLAQSFAYSEEADVLNIALFGFTAKQWREANSELAAKGANVRDFASVNELIVLSSLEGMNAEMLKQNLDLCDRLKKLTEIAKQQLRTLEKVDVQKSFRRTISGDFKPFFRDSNNGIGMFPNQSIGTMSGIRG